jgi:PKD repeat protein
MVRVRSFVGACLGVVVLAAVPAGARAATGGAAPAAAAATATVEADWEMNEAPGSRVMLDATGRHDGAISADATAAGLALTGSSYQWSLRCPDCPPAALPRVVQVPDSSALDIPDPAVTWSVEFRFKTNKGYGNIMQKGQALDAGGQIKVEDPNGFTQCVFIGANRTYVAVPSPIRLNDDQWHDFKCVHTATQVQTWVDGAEVAFKNVVTGPIDNAKPFVIGGKTACDQVKVTCDYYTGLVDWVKITRGDGAPANQPPTAAFTSGCGGLTCDFDGSGSADPERGTLTYAWRFGDGTTSTAASPSHAYGAAGSYPVTLTVTDPAGASASVTHQVTVNAAAGPVAFRAAASSNANVTTPSVTVPAAVQAGDALVLLATANRGATLTTPTGWTLLGTRADGTDLTSWAFTRTAQAGAGGSKVSMSLDAISKTSLTLLAYAGAGPVTTAASAAEPATSTAQHASPSVTVATPGSWVVSSWADKTPSGQSGWTLPALAQPRNANAGTGSGVVTAASGDTASVSAGTWQGLTASSGVASGKAISWSIVVPPA